MSKTPRKIKANGHIVQADWNQTNPLQMDYIQNKPENIITADNINDYTNHFVEYVSQNLTEEQKAQARINIGVDKVFKKIDQVDFKEEVYRFGDHMVVVPSSTSSGSSTYRGELSISDLPENTDVTISFAPGYDPASLNICWAENTKLYAQTMGGGWSCERIVVDDGSSSNVNTGNTEATLGYLYYEGGSSDTNSHWETQNEQIIWNTGGLSHLSIVLFEENEPISDGDSFIAKYADVKIKISYGKENQTSIHETILKSDTELYYNTKLTDLTINGLSRSFDRSIAQEWSIAFTAGDADPIITIPNSASFYVGTLDTNDPTILEDGKETLPIKWLYAEPTFEANKKYLITFKQIIDTIYGVWTVLE